MMKEDEEQWSPSHGEDTQILLSEFNGLTKAGCPFLSGSVILCAGWFHANISLPWDVQAPPVISNWMSQRSGKTTHAEDMSSTKWQDRRTRK